jgi:hypothetical protein
MTDAIPAQTTESIPQTVPGRTLIWRFVWHYIQMVIAMFVGMMALMPVWHLLVAQLGMAELLERPVPRSLAMATTMTIGMAAWLAFRRHSWIGIAEMGAATNTPAATATTRLVRVGV